MALMSLPWVRQAKVDYEKQRAVVTVIADRYDEKALLKALTKEDFKGKVLKDKRK